MRFLSIKGVAAFAATAVALIVLPEAASAQVASGTITQMIVQSGGVVFFNLSSIGTQRPSCAPSGRWALNVNAADGQAMLASLLTRQATQKSVEIHGKGTCSVWPDSEDVYLVVTQ